MKEGTKKEGKAGREELGRKEEREKKGENCLGL